MSQNLRLVNYFVSEFYRNRMIELEHVTSPDFSFTLHTGAKQSFTEFAARMGFVNDNAKLELGEIHSTDDTIFIAPSKVSIISEDGQEFIATGENSFLIKNELLEEVKVTYNLADNEFALMQKLLSANAAKSSPRSLEKRVESTDDEILFV